MNKISILFLGMAFLICAAASANNDNPYDTGEGLKNYKYYLTGSSNDWPDNSGFSEDLESKNICAGSYWTTHAFRKINGSTKICTGIKDLKYKAYIRSKNNLSGDFSRIVLTVYFNNNTDRQLLNSISVSFYENGDYDNSDTYNCAAVVGANPAYYFLDFPKEESEKQCRIDFDFEKGSEDNWLRLSEIRFFDLDTKPVDIIAKTENKSIQLKSNWGDLHVLTVEYDSSGNVVNEFPTLYSASDLRDMIISDDDHTWTNKVADQGVLYTVNAPTTDGHYMTLRAKAVQGSMHSSEVSGYLSSDGILTEAVMVEVDNEENVADKWYDITGREVSEPQKGMYIRVRGNKSTKVIR